MVQSKGIAQDYEEPPAAPPQTEVTDDGKPVGEAVEKSKKIIRDGEMRLEVDDLKAAKTFIDTTLKKFGAYYENERYESNDYQSSFYLKIRVPAVNFDDLVNMASEHAAKVTMKNINARDVTEEFYDIRTRLENNKSYMAQYRKLLTRANSIKDILEVQEKIRNLEEEMDSKKGRLKYISDRVKYSTLNLTLTQRHEWQDRDEKSFFEKTWTALKDGGGYFMEFVLVLFRLWPFIVLLAALIYFFKKWRRRKRE